MKTLLCLFGWEHSKETWQGHERAGTFSLPGVTIDFKIQKCSVIPTANLLRAASAPVNETIWLKKEAAGRFP
jgi:hypothetical protein